MRILGNIDLQYNNAMNFLFEPYDGSVEPFPTTGALPGRVIFRTDDMQVYVCVSDNPVTWQPIIKVANFYEYVQPINSTVWSIQHGLETENVLVQVYDTSGNKIMPEGIQIVDSNNVEVIFSEVTPAAGRALIIAIDTNIGTFVDRMSLSVDVLKSKTEIQNVTYDSNDNPTLVEYKDGTRAELTYTTFDEVSTITFKNSIGTIIEQWQYGYDTNNRLISTTKLV